MSSMTKKILLICVIGLIGVGCYVGYPWLRHKLSYMISFGPGSKRLGNKNSENKDNSGESNSDHIPTSCSKPELDSAVDQVNANQVQVVGKVISSAQLWRPIQEKAKDTVVQIFSHVAVMDLLRPYRSPTEGSGWGSGFFIDAEGHIVTNAHVINEAKSVYIQIPSFGKRIIDVDIVGMSPDRDIALLKLTPESLALLRSELGQVSFLPLGDSDAVFRSDEVLALGYPLGQQSLKSTNGIVSGREQGMIQMSAPINPGSSGGPLVNSKGQVVGINSSGVVEAQNVGYARPINDLKIVLPDLKKVRMVRKPFLGVVFNNASDTLTEFLNNPQPGGCYVVEVVKGSPLQKIGVESGDMIYEINGYRVDVFGEMCVPWCEDKITLLEYVSRLSIGEIIKIVVYRKGERKEFSLTFGYAELPAIRKVYPGYDDIDYEIFAGMVVMQLTLNHIQLIGPQAPGLAIFAEMRRSAEPVLVVTHVFRNSQLYRARTINVGSTLREVNGFAVSTLEDLRKAFKKGMSSKFLTIRATDNVTRSTDNIFVALPLEKVLAEEPLLAKNYIYPITEHTKELLKIAQAQKALAKS